MELIRDSWSVANINEFNKYLESIKRVEKIEFSKRVVNTSMEVLGINNPTCKEIAKKIQKGNFIDFLEKNDFKYYESTLVQAYLINYIKDAKEKEKYINKLYLDNWATVDALTFKVKNNETEYLNLAK